jgi:hypothetical protein
MVVNIASLPSTVTFVTGAVRGRGCGKGACAPAASGSTAAAHKTRQAICLKKLAMNMVAILIQPDTLRLPLSMWDRYSRAFHFRFTPFAGGNKDLSRCYVILPIYRRLCDESRNPCPLHGPSRPTLAASSRIC